MKRFGKLRQWTDEKLGASQKTIATEEFRDLEAEMTLRQQGLESILVAMSHWLRALGKKKEGHDKVKGTPLELLGIAMFQHSEEFSSDSAYGHALNRLGIAQQKIARAQEVLQKTVSETIIVPMEESLLAMKEYQAARRKLESRRLTYDATLSRMQKTKKEDAKLEEDLRVATARYEETSDEVQTRMIEIREAEQGSLLDLTRLIEAEAEFFNQAQSIMQDLQPSLSIGSSSQYVKVPILSASLPLTAERPVAPARIMSQNYSSMPSLLRMSEQEGRVDARPSVSTDNKGAEPCPEYLSRLQITQQEKNLLKNHRPKALERHTTVVANFTFDAENTNELSLKSGDIVAVSKESPDGWWEGRLLNSCGKPTFRKGLFPANYCSPCTGQILPRQGEQGFLVSSPEQQPGLKQDSVAKETISVSMSEIEKPHFACKAAGRGRPPPPPVPKKKASAPQRISSQT